MGRIHSLGVCTHLCPLAKSSQGSFFRQPRSVLSQVESRQSPQRGEMGCVWMVLALRRLVLSLGGTGGRGIGGGVGWLGGRGTHPS